MTIEITGQSGNPNSLKAKGEGAEVSVARQEPTAPQDETGPPSTSDTVSITDAAARLQSLENTLAELPVVDTQRVEAVKQAISSGSFEVDSARIADKLLNFEQALSR